MLLAGGLFGNIDRTLFVVKDKSVIINAAFHKPAVDPLRVFVLESIPNFV